MSPLPSFVELMESLGLAPDSKLPCSSASSHSRSPSISPPPSQMGQLPRPASPRIIVSQYDTPGEGNEFKRRASSGNIKTTRFSPYSSNTHRRSASAAGDRQRDAEHKTARSSSVSRRSSSGSSNSNSSADSVPPVPPLPARRSRGGSLESLKVTGTSCTPISSFARRRSPQASPTSPSFASSRARSASTELPSPVMLPTLPPMLADSLATFSFPSSVGKGAKSGSSSKNRRTPSRSPRSSPMELDQESRPFVKHHQAGLRISSLHRQIAPIA